MVAKDCKPGKTKSPFTNRCVKICPPDYIRARRGCIKKQTTSPRPSVLVRVSSPVCLGRSKVTLKDYQKRACKHFIHNRGLIVVFSTGSGKSLTAIAASQCFLDKYKTTGKIIVVTPVSLLNNFKKEMPKYGVEDRHLKSYSYYTYEGFINAFKKGSLHLEHAMIIVDEAHNFRTLPLIKKGVKSRAYYMIQACQQAKRVMCLTATPFVNGQGDVENLQKMVRLEKDWDKSPKCLFSFYNRGASDDAYPSSTEEVVEIPMSNSYFEHYKKILKLDFRITNYDKIPKSATFWISLRQAVNGLNDSFQSPKVLWCKNIIRQYVRQGKKCLLYSSFLHSGVSKIAKHLEDLRISYRTIKGSMSIGDRKKAVDDYNNNKVKVLLITKAGSEGLDLKNTRLVILLDPVWNPSAEHQIVSRAIRFGSHLMLPPSERNVKIVHPVLVFPKSVKDSPLVSIDTYIMNQLSGEKKKIIDDLLCMYERDFSIERHRC